MSVRQVQATSKKVKALKIGAIIVLVSLGSITETIEPVSWSVSVVYIYWVVTEKI